MQSVGQDGWKVGDAVQALQHILPEYSADQLAEVTHFLDENGDGIIQASELKAAFEAIDSDDLAADLQWRQAFMSSIGELLHRNQRTLKAGLRAFDTNNTGLIAPDDLVFALECVSSLGVNQSPSPIKGDVKRLDPATIQLLVASVEKNEEGMLEYRTWLQGFQVQPTPIRDLMGRIDCEVHDVVSHFI